MPHDTGAPNGTQRTLRDWIDPTRIYNIYVPAERRPFFWGLAVYPLIVFMLLFTPILIAMESSSSAANSSDNIGIITYCFMIVWVIAAVCATYRRLRYLHMSPRWVWLIVLPPIYLIFVLYLLIKSKPSASG